MHWWSGWASGAVVVVDAGVLRDEGEASSGGSGDELRWRLAAEADRSVLVTRACYLALRRTVSLTVRPSGVVLVAEAGRALTKSDCERAIGAPVLATVARRPRHRSISGRRDAADACAQGCHQGSWSADRGALNGGLESQWRRQGGH